MTTKTSTKTVKTPTERVYDFVLRSGNAGVTDEDIFVGLNQSLTPRADRHRRASLELTGMIVKTGVRLNARNRPVAVFKAAKVVKKTARA